MNNTFSSLKEGDTVYVIDLSGNINKAIVNVITKRLMFTEFQASTKECNIKWDVYNDSLDKYKSIYNTQSKRICPSLEFLKDTVDLLIHRNVRINNTLQKELESILK